MDDKERNYAVEAAYGAIVADGFFALALAVHLVGVPAGGLSLLEFLLAGLIFSIFLSACWVIYDQYWAVRKRVEAVVVKMLRIKELRQGAQLEFDGKRYKVDNIDKVNGEIQIQRVGQPGRIIVQIEGMSS